MLPDDPTTPTPAPTFRDVAVPGVAHLRRIVGPLGDHEFCAAGAVAARLAELERLRAEARARRARGRG